MYCQLVLVTLAPTERQEKPYIGREQLGLENVYSETRRQKEDGGIKRRDWNEETPEDEDSGEQTVMGKTRTENE